MARPRQEGLTAREMEIMQVIWCVEEATVDVIQNALPDRLVDSTIRTLLQIMEDKGYVRSQRQGRANVYCAAIAQDAVQTSALKQMVQRLFGGSPEMLLARLVEEEQLDLDEVERLREQLREQKGGTA